MKNEKTAPLQILQILKEIIREYYEQIDITTNQMKGSNS